MKHKPIKLIKRSFLFFTLLFLMNCRLFLSEKEVLIKIPDYSIYPEADLFPDKYRIEISSSGGDSFSFVGNTGESISVRLADNTPYVLLAYPLFPNKNFRGFPLGAFYRSGQTEEGIVVFNRETAAGVLPLAELFKAGYSLPGFNCYRMSSLFRNRSSLSPFGYDFPGIKNDILLEKFSMRSLRKKEEYSVSLLGIPQGKYVPADSFLEIVSVNSDEVFETSIYWGFHQYLSEEGILLELSCSRDGEVLFLINRR